LFYSIYIYIIILYNIYNLKLMQKFLIWILLFIPINIYAIDNFWDSWNIEIQKTISETSNDLNQDKLKIQVSSGLLVESWFWNNSSNWQDLTFYIQKLLKYVSFIVSVVALLSIIFISVSLIFINEEWKVKEYREILIRIIIWFLFYWFLAGWVYVWIINTWKKYSESYNSELIEQTIKDVNISPPTLLK